MLQELLQPLLFAVITCKAMRASEVAGFPLVAVVALVGCWFDFISGIFRYLSENAVHQSDHIYIYIYSMRIGTFKVSVGGVHPSRPFSFPKGSRTGVLFFLFFFAVTEEVFTW